MKTITNCVLVSILFLGLALAAAAATPDTTDKSGMLTIPWDEFKLFLNLDDDEIVISMELFQKMLTMTGVKYVPSNVKGGNVVLTRSEFESIINQMKTPVHGAQGRPVDYLITKAVYDGRMNKGSTAFTGKFKVHVLKKNAYMKIPIIPASVPLEDITVDGKPALVINEGGYHSIVLSREGEYSIEATFSLASSLEKGPNKIDLSIAQTPITLLNLVMPLKDIEVEIPQAQQVITSNGGNTTTVRAAIRSGNNISVRWRKKTAPADKIPPKLYSELYHLISIEDGAMTVTTDINLRIVYSEIDAVRVAIPEGCHVLSLSGEGVGEWQEMTTDSGNFVLIPFTYAKKGTMNIHLYSEIPATETGLANVFEGIRVVESVRETGFIGIVLNTSAEVTVAESNGLEIVPAQKLPAQIVSKSAKPLTMGFKYLKHPYNLVLDIKKHDKVSVPVAAINSANVVTLFTEDGKIVHRLVYQVKNSSKQFLQIRMPSDADVWSVLVDNKPVESSVNGEGELLVPLIKSRQNGNQLQSFPVEVIYCMVQDKFAWLGSRGSALPAVDLLISQVMWSVYLPNDYTYHHFGSSLEIEEMVRGVNIFSGSRRSYDEQAMKELSDATKVEPGMFAYEELKKAYRDGDLDSRFRNVPMPVESQKIQISNELEFSGRMEGLAELGASSLSGGVLPIQIQVPTGGQVYRFARTIIKPNDPLTFEVTYSRYWATGLLKWVLLLIAAVILWANRRKFGKPWKLLKEAAQKHEAAIKNAAKSNITPFVLFGLAIVFSGYSIRLFLLCFFLFWISAIYHALRYRKKVIAERAKLKPSATDQPAQPAAE